MAQLGHLVKALSIWLILELKNPDADDKHVSRKNDLDPMHYQCLLF